MTPRRMHGSLAVMTDGASDRETYERVADAMSDALRTLAHDAANCAAVFDMEVSELGAHDATGVGDSLRAATDRLKAHVSDLRSLAASRREGDAALDEVLALALRLLSRSARRDLARIPGERVQTRVRAPQILVLISTLIAVRALVLPQEARGLVGASVGPHGDRGVIELTVESEAALDGLTGIIGRAITGCGTASSTLLEGAATPTFALRISFPLA